MLAYRWPGNVRELENILERAIVKCQGSAIVDVDLPVVSHHLAAASTYIASNDAALTLKQWLLKSEKEYLRGLLMKHEGSISATAVEANVDNKTLYRKMKRHGLQKESFKEM